MTELNSAVSKEVKNHGRHKNGFEPHETI